MSVEVLTLAAAPELAGTMRALDAQWPEFLLHSRSAALLPQTIEAFPDLQFLVRVDGSVDAVGHSVPLPWDNQVESLGDEGWDWALELAFREQGAPGAICGLEINVRSEARGRGLAAVAVGAMRDLATAAGLDLVIPVRPNRKHEYPEVPFDEYVNWLRPDGQAFDPWLRVHRRLGGRPLRIAHKALTVESTVGDWRAWTGMRFERSGSYPVPHALVPVEIDLDEDRGRYEEPNLWILHDRHGATSTT